MHHGTLGQSSSALLWTNYFPLLRRLGIRNSHCVLGRIHPNYATGDTFFSGAIHPP